MGVVVPRNSWAFFRVVAMAWVLAALVPEQGVLAGTGDVYVRPGRVSGLEVTVAATWPEVNGTRPCRITIKPLGRSKFKQDRDLTIRMFPYRWRGESNYKNIDVEQDLFCEEGTDSATVTIMLQQIGWITGLDLQVYESGQKLKDVSTTFAFPATNNNRNRFREGLPSILLLDSRADGRAITRSVPVWLGTFDKSMQNLATIQNFDADSGKFELKDMRRFSVLAPRDLPTNWVGLGCLDLVLIQMDELQRMQRLVPDQWSALEAWTLGGGNLVVFDVGRSFHRAGELETMLDLSTENAESNKWERPPLKNRTRSVEFFSPRSQRLAGRNPVRRGPPASRAETCFMYRPMGGGLLIAATGQKAPFYTEAEWKWFFNSISADRWLAYRRLGAAVESPNSDFWTFRIKGVGRAPVNAFRILITLFVLVIGPLNYFSLRRVRRPSWMLVTVPMGALLATGCLLGYALITDGLGVRARVRSLTHYDQRTGHVQSWSRQVYYASIVPSGGMSFPEDAMVVPLKYPARRDPRVRRSILWDRSQQILRTGYLTSRTLAQFFVVRSRESSSGLEVIEETTGPPQVANRLGVKLRYLYVLDSAGNLYEAENVEIDQQLTLVPADVAVANNRLSKFARLILDGEQGGPYYGRRVDNNLPAPSQETSLLEQRLSNVRIGATALDAQSFVAVADGSQEVPLGVKRAREEDSLHIITGQW